ncbi:hypothetical protein [Glutamicibacter arilaitensis]|uniref:hypothetical protein n=1 Tax=Glutamicibacter arilaitensis TaxID=256701 RepID=UPI003F9284B7
MTHDRIEYLRTENDAERLSYGELIEIQSAFEQIHPSKLSDDPANAVASDMLNEIEANLLMRNESTMTDKTPQQVIADIEQLVADLTPSKRAELAGAAARALRVPYTVWSPEDYEDYAKDQLEKSACEEATEAEVEALAVEAFEQHADCGTDLQDGEWGAIQAQVESAFDARFETKEAQHLAEGDLIYFTDRDRDIYHRLMSVETVEIDEQGSVHLDLSGGQETYSGTYPVDYLPANWRD